MQRLRVGLIGVGRQGSIHLEQLTQSSYYEFIGCYDNNTDKLSRIADEYQVRSFPDADSLIASVDVVSIATPASSHYCYAEKALRKSKHVFIENPITEDIVEAERIVELAREADVKVQIGHIERFNPVFRAIRNLDPQPMFIEAQRIAPFDGKRIRNSVVLDLMIHDIDLVLNLVKANIKYIHASGVSVFSPLADIVNARIEFDNGCVASLTASRASLNKMRRMQLFESSFYYSMDFIKREAEHVYIEEQAIHGGIPVILDNEKKYVTSTLVEATEYDALKMQLESFALSITENNRPEVTVDHGYKALDVANIIIQKVNRNKN